MSTNEKSSAVLTDAEFKKALECHANSDLATCKVCPLLNRPGCAYTLSEIALDLINRLEADKEALIAGQETLQKALAEKNAEIEELTGNLKFVRGTVERQKVDNERLKNLLAEEEAKYSECAKRFYKEGVKEFWSRLHGIAYRSEVEWSHGEHPMLIELDDAEEIYEEMVGDAE